MAEGFEADEWQVCDEEGVREMNQQAAELRNWELRT